MKYSKPEVVRLVSAVNSIQNPSDKSETDIVDGANPPQYASVGAYAADE